MDEQPSWLGELAEVLNEQRQILKKLSTQKPTEKKSSEGIFVKTQKTEQPKEPEKKEEPKKQQSIDEDLKKQIVANQVQSNQNLKNLSDQNTLNTINIIEKLAPKQSEDIDQNNMDLAKIPKIESTKNTNELQNISVQVKLPEPTPVPPKITNEKVTEQKPKEQLKEVEIKGNITEVSTKPKEPTAKQETKIETQKIPEIKEKNVLDSIDKKGDELKIKKAENIAKPLVVEEITKQNNIDKVETAISNKITETKPRTEGQKEEQQKSTPTATDIINKTLEEPFKLEVTGELNVTPTTEKKTPIADQKQQLQEPIITKQQEQKIPETSEKPATPLTPKTEQTFNKAEFTEKPKITTETILKNVTEGKQERENINVVKPTAKDETLISINNTLTQIEQNMVKNNQQLEKMLSNLISIATQILQTLPTLASSGMAQSEATLGQQQSQVEMPTSIDNYRASFRDYNAPGSSRARSGMPGTPGFFI